MNKHKKSKLVKIARLCAVVFVFCSLVLARQSSPSAHAAPLPPRTPIHPPIPPTASQPDTTSAIVDTPLSLPGLSAVVIVGPIDGDTGSWTLSEISNAESTASQLEAYGVNVQRFYTPNNNWSQITQAAAGAHFLIYRGHGVYWTSPPSPDVGGFYLKDQFISPDQIRQDLDLATHAIVMLYGCFTAGSSSSDDYGIDFTEARRRVAQYSDPFLDIDAAGYYANWYGSAFRVFVDNLFSGQTLESAYQSYFDFNASTAVQTTHPDHPGNTMWLDKDYWSGRWEYNNAFVGLADATLLDLFAPPALGQLPAEIAFYYSIPEQRFLAAGAYLDIVNVGNELPLDWTIDTEGEWFDTTPSAGQSPGTLSITPDSFDPFNPGAFTGSVTITVVDPQSVAGNPQTVDLSLHVVSTEFQEIYIPLVVSQR